MNLYLVGFMASGKSTLGRYLSEYSGRSFRDLDRIIELEARMSIREIFERENETGFREREADALENLAGHDGFIVATGGGVIELPRNREVLRGGFTVFIDWSWEILEPWLGTVSKHSRPLLEQDDAAVRDLFFRRRPLYREVADRCETIEEMSAEGLSKTLSDLCEGIHEALLAAEREALE